MKYVIVFGYYKTGAFFVQYLSIYDCQIQTIVENLKWSPEKLHHTVFARRLIDYIYSKFGLISKSNCFRNTLVIALNFHKYVLCLVTIILFLVSSNKWWERSCLIDCTVSTTESFCFCILLLVLITLFCSSVWPQPKFFFSLSNFFASGILVKKSSVVIFFPRCKYGSANFVCTSTTNQKTLCQIYKAY